MRVQTSTVRALGHGHARAALPWTQGHVSGTEAARGRGTHHCPEREGGSGLDAQTSGTHFVQHRGWQVVRASGSEGRVNSQAEAVREMGKLL